MLSLEMIILVGTAALLERSWSPVTILKTVAVVQGCVVPTQFLELGKQSFAAMGSILEKCSCIER